MAELNELTINGSKYTFEDDVARELATTEARRAQEAENSKVDKVADKGLSTNDYTNAEKAKLAELENYDDTQIRQLINEEKTTRQQGDNALSESVTQEETRAKGAEQTLQLAIDIINGKIPAQATAQNQLADKEFVNSSISTATADFKGTYNSLQELEQETANANDYAFVLATDAAGNTVYKRYKWVDSSGWTWEYDLNNSSFTAAQWAAIQSGITAALVTKLSDLPNNSTLNQRITQAITTSLLNYYTKSEIDAALASKQDVIQDLANIRSGAQAGSTAVQPSTLNSVVKNTVAESGVYDVSANNDNTKFESLNALLSSANLNALIPTDIRKGGMSIKFVQTTPAKYTVVKTEGLTEQPTGTEIMSDPSIASGTYEASQLSAFSTLPATLNSSLTYYLAVTDTVDEQEVTTYTTWVIKYVQSSDNNYIQFRYMSSSTAVADFTNVANWQGVDGEPTAGSDNLVKSGGVYAKTVEVLKSQLKENIYIHSGNPPYLYRTNNYNIIYTFIPKGIEFIVNIDLVTNTTVAIAFSSEVPQINTSLFDTNTINLKNLNKYIVNSVDYNRYFIIGYPNSINLSITLVNTHSISNILNLLSEGYSYYGIASKEANFLDNIQISDNKGAFFLITSPGNYKAWNIPNGVDFLKSEVPCFYKKTANSNVWYKDTFNLDANCINIVYDNSEDLSIPLTDFFNPMVNSGKFGRYWENLIGKSITGVVLNSSINKNMKYGLGTITNNIVGNFEEIGTIAVTSGVHEYIFSEPIILQEGQVIYFEGSRLCYVRSFNNNNSFLDGFHGNNITNTNFEYSYYLVYSESVEKSLKELKEELNESEHQISIINEAIEELEKTVHYCAIGDSITAGAYGEGWSQEDVNGLSYADYLQNLIGTTEFVKRAHGGYSIYSRMDYLISRVPDTINLITICLGINDITEHISNNIPIGDHVQIIKATAAEDFENIDFYGNNILGRYRWCLEKVKSLHPNSKIVAIGIPSCVYTDQNIIDTWNNIKYGECAICNYLGIPYLDFQNLSPIFTAHTDSTKPNWADFLHDGTHPEKEGYHIMATAIYSLLKGLI